MVEEYDVVVVGAGLSGVGMACHLKRLRPRATFLVIEARETVGGTWDLFRYPGVRSDSDMFTLGYAFKPWTQGKAIADGPSILAYIRETADEHGVTPHIQFRTRLLRADWSSSEACWTLSLDHAGAAKTVRCKMVAMCAGYYRYDQGYLPDFAGMADYKGAVVHPQFWPADFDARGKRIAVIGSGATAVTLVPALAQVAAHVTMVQRSPTYMFSAPSSDTLANLLRALLPAQTAYRWTRAYRTFLQRYFYRRAREKPELVKRRLIEQVRRLVGPDVDVEKHFTPRYKPWDQRLCLVPDADFFEALRARRAAIVTGHIDRFTETGLLMRDGERVEADVIVTATGLVLQNAGGASVAVDGRAVDFGAVTTYKGAMYSDVPNLVNVMGYINASWTLRSDLLAEFACRLLALMEDRGVDQVTPRLPAGYAGHEPMVDFTSSYFQRGFAILPKQGQAMPWRQPQDYALDRQALIVEIDDPALEFRTRETAAPRETA